MKLTLTQAVAASALAVAAVNANAAAVNNGNQLTITAGAPTYDAYGNQINIPTGSWFGMDTDNNSKIAGTEKTALSMGNMGVIIGMATAPGASHGGEPVPGDTNDVTAPWGFFGNTGSDYFVTGTTGSTEAGLNFSGWRVTWNGIPEINMGGGAWGTGYTNGIAKFNWDGTDGGAYTLSYRATVPVGDPSGFGGVKYELFLTGNVHTVPVPEAETWAMMLAGLGLVGGLVSRRRKTLA